MKKLKEQEYRVAAEAAHNAASTVARYRGASTRTWDQLTVGEQIEKWQSTESGMYKRPADKDAAELQHFEREVAQRALRILEGEKHKAEEPKAEEPKVTDPNDTAPPAAEPATGEGTPIQ